MTKKILVGNWKMNLLPTSAKDLTSKLCPLSKKVNNCEIWLAPAAPLISTVALAAAQSQIKVGAQNVHWKESGAFTGELSAEMLRALGCSFALTGHSERRHIFHETAQESASRAAFALTQGLDVIFCVGETIEQRKSGLTEQTVDQQLSELFKLLPQKCGQQLLIAYEPVWAIGSGVAATIQDIELVHRYIANKLAGTPSQTNAPILYGGSVSPENIAEILSLPLVAGALIGGASLSFDKWSSMLDKAEAC